MYPPPELNQTDHNLQPSDPKPTNPQKNIIMTLIPSFSSKCGHVTEKHVLIGCKHDTFGSQTFEV